MYRLDKSVTPELFYSSSYYPFGLCLRMYQVKLQHGMPMEHG